MNDIGITRYYFNFSIFISSFVFNIGTANWIYENNYTIFVTCPRINF